MREMHNIHQRSFDFLWFLFVVKKVIVCVCVCVYMHVCVHACERVTGRKIRVLQTEEIGCKCQTFFISPLSSRRKQTTSVRYFFLLHKKLKVSFLYGNGFLTMLMKLCICFGIFLSSKCFYLRLTFFFCQTLG